MRTTALLLVSWVCACVGPSSATQLIGPAGGSIALEDVTLVVPPGALPAETRITITRLADGAPAGYRALTSLYRFQPSGLSFATPAAVTFRTAEPTDGAEVLWTGDGWERLASTVSGRLVSAPVTHFSDGFAGLPEGPDDDGGPDAPWGDTPTLDTPEPSDAPDAPELDAPVLDAPELDAPVLDAPELDAPDAPLTDGGEPDAAGSFACGAYGSTAPLPCHPTGCGGLGGGVLESFTVTERSQITISAAHSLVSMRDWGLGAGSCPVSASATCDHGGTSLLSTFAVDPGTYFFVQCVAPAGFDRIVEPVPPPPPNTSCATAIPVTTTLPGRLVGTDSLYYRYDWNAGWPSTQAVSFDSPEPYTTMQVSLRTVCDDPSSEVWHSPVDYGPLWDLDMPGRYGSYLEPATLDAAGPAVRYYIVLSGITPGTVLRSYLYPTGR